MDEPDRKKSRMKMEAGAGKIESDAALESSFDNQKNFNKTPETSEIVDSAASDFKIVSTKLTFVDKSESIILFLENFSVLHITAPRRFGKTTFMNMLKTFLEITVDEDAKPISNPSNSDNYKLFMKLKLGQNHEDFVKKHCGQYPVIFLSLKDVKGETKRDVLDSLKEAICKAFQEHSYLLGKAADGTSCFKNKNIMDIKTFLNYYSSDRLEELSVTNVTFALKFLSGILYTHFNKKVVILIDDTDAPIMNGIMNNIDDETLRYLISLLTSLLSAGLKDNRYLERALLNSCVRLSEVFGGTGGFSWQLNNQVYVLFLQGVFSKTYGFTEKEVKNLLEKNEFKVAKDFDGVRKWYGGYQVLDNDEERIYNSWSVVHYLAKSVEKQKKMFDNYWAMPDYLKILQKLFVRPEIQEVVKKLVEDKNIVIKEDEATVDNILELKNLIFDPQNVRLNTSQVNFFLKLLWDDGLLNAVEKCRSVVTLKIPNLEIKKEIERNCYTQSLFETKYKLKATNIERYIQALKQLQLITSNEESKIEDSEEGTAQKCEDAMSNLVNAISLLFSDGATIPVTELELHHILFYLAYNNTAFSTQSHRPILKVSNEIRENTEQCKAKISHQSKGKEKRGRKSECDMCVTFETVAVIFEFKFPEDTEAENSKAALEQMIDRNYFKFFEKEEYKNIKTKIYAGICFGKNLDVTTHYLINDTDVGKAKFLRSIPV